MSKRVSYSDQKKYAAHQAKCIAKSTTSDLNASKRESAVSNVLAAAADAFVKASVDPVVCAPDDRRAGPTAECAACSRKRVLKNDDKDGFKCTGFDCQRMQHWSCAGVAVPPEDVMLGTLCCICLAVYDMPRDTVAYAVMGRAMAVTYAASLGGTVRMVEPNGWCLFTCAELATSVNKRHLLMSSIKVILEGGIDNVLGMCDNDTCSLVKVQAEVFMSEYGLAYT